MPQELAGSVAVSTPVWLDRAFRLAGEVAATQGDFQAVASVAMEKVLELFGGDGACLEIADGDDMVYEAATGIAEPFLGLRLPIGSSLSGMTMQAGVPAVCHDTETDPRVNRGACRKIGLRSMLLLPLRYGERSLGVLKAMSGQADTFGSPEEPALATLSQILGAVIGRARSEEALRQSEERYRATFDNLALGIVEGSLDGRLLRANEAMGRIVGRPMDEIIGATIADLTYPEDRAEDQQLIRRLLDGEITHYSREKRYVRGDGDLVWVSVTISLVRDASGAPAKMVGIVQDISARKEAEASRDAAVAASSARSQFLANMSHEIRTPMNGVIGLASLLQERPLDDESRNLVRTMASSSETLLRIIDDVLDLSKLESGHLAFEAVPTDVVQVVAEVVALYEANARRKGLALDPQGPAIPAPRVLGDPVRLRQVLSNLVSNAIKFTERGQVLVSWSWERNGEQVEIRMEVRDTGIGIPADRLDRVFDSFTQADESTQRRFGGTGLGLTISRQLVEMMGGRLDVSSKVGVGTTFGMSLSLEAAGGEALQTPPSAAECELPAGLRVLLAEDNEINVMVASSMLESLGCDVDVASDGLRAIDLVARAKYDVVLMDVQMPRCDGRTATIVIREREALAGDRRVPIVALTANALNEDRQACMAAGMDGFLTKPITLDTLRAALAAIFA